MSDENSQREPLLAGGGEEINQPYPHQQQNGLFCGLNFGQNQQYFHPYPDGLYDYQTVPGTPLFVVLVVFSQLAHNALSTFI